MMDAIYEGKVVDRNDPLGLGRIKAQVPNVFKTKSDWLRPMGPFDSNAGRGVWFVPSVGASVDVMFVHGDENMPDSGRYLCGSWGRPAGVTDVPIDAQVGGKGDPDIVVFAFTGFAIIIDERTNQEKLTIVDKTNQSFIRVDAVNKSIDMQSLEDFGVTVGKDKATRVTGDRSETVGGDDSILVAGDRTEQVAGKLNTTMNERDETVVTNDSKAVHGDWTVNVQGNVEVTAQGNAKLKATGTATIDGATVKLGETASIGVVLASIKTWIDMHIHFIAATPNPTGATIPTLPPATPSPPTDYSTTVKAKS